jgi:hypothetical protein
MKKVLDWIKGNVVALVCALLVLVAAGWIFLINGWGGEFTKRLQTRLERNKALASFQSQNVSFPSPKTEGGTENKSLTINRAVITQLKEVYSKMEREGKGIFETARRFNSVQQTPMTTNLFPDNKDTSLRIIARRDYQSSFLEMFEPYSSSAGVPRLRARPPITEGEIEVQLKSAREAYLVGTLGGRAEGSLNDLEREKLAEEVLKKRVEVYQLYAKSLNIYTSTNKLGAGDFPFQVMGWSTQGTPANDLQLWEGQMQLWIQQDMARVIALTNSVSQQDTNVTKSPIKKLNRMEVKPGYIGLGGRAMPTDSGAAASGGGELKLNPAEDDFSLSPTGRRSNELYDVRHAKLDVVVDIVRLPEFFDNMVQVNYLTVLNMDVTDEDEYDALKRNYYYGDGDCVRIVLDIESIWLRDWTSKLMPAQVKADLGVPIEAPK